MATVLIPLAEGFEEIEAVTLIDVLRRAEIDVVTASLTEDLNITASRGVRLVADATLDAVIDDEFDMMVLPGGQPGTNNLNADQRIHALLKRFNQADKWLGAICAAPMVLAHVGLLEGVSVSCYPGALKPSEWPEIQFSNDAVVCDNKIITSRGPGTAMAFALTIIEKLMDEETREQVETSLVIR
ncbi:MULTISPECIES: DJ-1 family glyoxalase III [unclassified Methylophaga]|jgi:4-methyl-5(b-hydroxyethyl)-thiazole monophosphate biosynthesis|uniref:DJ-1 family glyoxalase III n=2 Tax=Methylophaga TaxID=40222 RepID=UPI000C468DE2|nr:MULTISPECIES: DJ-1 family glyoxalase III [unclassified Methylophaga]MAL48658.1 DJ-1 family protein [Methylophaga sp.]MAP27427.1 DJ-1 family protein [Methylophaga sp.]MBP24952.1 DJ-1 family protein [Methylophaga sp.]HAD32391.1 DJ-1 family protein [Methylophaga sp.]HBX59549.1 DJ-1 family protein [Methylophaga sp.]|tara:strand:+ start:441 stop:995 length:555 start_codon:yes stop_codon:yes gene_type:complete